MAGGRSASAIFSVPASVLTQANAHLISALPSEGCGWLLQRAGQWRVWPVTNALRAKNAAAARRQFVMEPAELIAVLRACDASGSRLAAMYHSHVDAPAVISARDSRDWAPLGTPLYPNTALLIASVGEAQATEWRAFRWIGGGLTTVSLKVTRGESEDKSNQDRYDDVDVPDSAAPATRLPR